MYVSLFDSCLNVILCRGSIYIGGKLKLVESRYMRNRDANTKWDCKHECA